MEKFELVGLKNFDDFEIKFINDIVKNYVRKIRLENIKLKIQCKKYEKEGKRHHYSFHVTLDRGIAVKDDDWDLTIALHKTMDKLLNKVEGDFKKEGKKFSKAGFFKRWVLNKR